MLNKVVCRTELRDKNRFRVVSAVHVPNNMLANKTQHVGEICTQWTRYLRPCEMSLWDRSKAFWSIMAHISFVCFVVDGHQKGTRTRDILCQKEEYYIIIIIEIQNIIIAIMFATLPWSPTSSICAKQFTCQWNMHVVEIFISSKLMWFCMAYIHFAFCGRDWYQGWINIRGLRFSLPKRWTFYNYH